MHYKTGILITALITNIAHSLFCGDMQHNIIFLPEDIIHNQITPRLNIQSLLSCRLTNATLRNEIVIPIKSINMNLTLDNALGDNSRFKNEISHLIFTMLLKNQLHAYSVHL